MNFEKGFITILTGVYSFQDCVHFLAAVRRVHDEPIVILIDRVPWFLRMLLTTFSNVILKPAPSHPNPVLASRQSKLALYDLSPFEKTIYLDCDICLLANIGELFDALDQVDFLVTKDVQPDITKATNLLRVQQDVLPTLMATGLPVDEHTVHYNSGLIGFRRSDVNAQLFSYFKQYFEHVIQHQDVLLLRDQGAFAAAIAMAKPNLKVLPPTYNFLDKWKKVYELSDEPIKVLHCTYPYRPQYAKDLTRSIYTKAFDQIAKLFLPTQLQNPWRKRGVQ